MSDTMNLANMIEDVKEKLNDKEYKDILDTTMKIHNASSDLSVGRVHEIYVEGLHKIMEEIGGYNWRGFANAAFPSRVPSLVDNIVDDIVRLKELQEYKKDQQEKTEWYYSWVCGHIRTDEIQEEIWTLECYIRGGLRDSTDETLRGLFYLYLYRYDEINEQESEALDNLFDWYCDDDEDDYYGFLDGQPFGLYTIGHLWDLMYKCRQEHYLTYDFLEAISVY